MGGAKSARHQRACRAFFPRLTRQMATVVVALAVCLNGWLDSFTSGHVHFPCVSLCLIQNILASVAQCNGCTLNLAVSDEKCSYKTQQWLCSCFPLFISRFGCELTLRRGTRQRIGWTVR